jgi:hypothetical protein
MPTILKREPVVWQVLILASINLLVVFGVVHLTDVQLGGVNSFLAAGLGFLVRQQVTPLADPRTRENQPAELVAVKQRDVADAAQPGVPAAA